MSSLTSILNDYFSAPISNEHEVVYRALKRLHPESHLQHVGYLLRYGSQFQLLEYLKSVSVEVLVEDVELHEGLNWNAGAVVSETTDGETTGTKGRLDRHVQTGILHFEHDGTKFKVYQVSWTKERLPHTFFDFIFESGYPSETAHKAEDDMLLYKYTPASNSPRNIASARLETPAHQLITAAHRYSDAIKDEIWVFHRGMWNKEKSLYNAISKASWSELTLPPDFLDNLRRDTQTFFSSKGIYEELGVTWKRGLLMLGPPGNGKTESVKVLLKEAGQTALYVKSFTTGRGPEQGVESIFRHARAHAPCILVIEDLDSLVTPEVRSFFLNELDGLAENAGILTIATTNHPELIDDAILNRPSRFDVKYTFNCPTLELRKIYVDRWIEKAEKGGRGGNLRSGIVFQEKERTSSEVAKRTEGWSYAFLKELFVSFLLRIAHDNARVPREQDIETSSSSTPVDQLLLDQLEKLAVQVNTTGTDDKQDKAGGNKNATRMVYAQRAFGDTFDAMLGGSSDRWR